jgi:hypothetical protein
MSKCTTYESDILNEFCTELFSTEYRDYESSVQNSKTDFIFDYENFEEWFDNLIDSFVEDTELDITREDVENELKKCSQFIEDMKSEYEELKEMCREFYEDDDDE